MLPDCPPCHLSRGSPYISGFARSCPGSDLPGMCACSTCPHGSIMFHYHLRHSPTLRAFAVLLPPQKDSVGTPWPSKRSQEAKTQLNYIVSWNQEHATKCCQKVLLSNPWDDEPLVCDPCNRLAKGPTTQASAQKHKHSFQVFSIPND